MNGAPKSPSLSGRLQGVILVFILAAAAFFLGRQIPLIGGAVAGILLGILIRNTLGVRPVFLPGIGFASKRILQAGIVFIGAGLDLQQIRAAGQASLLVILVCILAALASAVVLGRTMRVPTRLRTLIGVGTAICGGTAIVAVSPLIGAREDEVSYAISTIFLFNIAAVLLFPVAGLLMGMSADAFGLWAGTAIHDTSSVVAAGYAYSEAAGETATIVKLTRTLMLVPVAMGAALAGTLGAGGKGKPSAGYLRRSFPWFVLWFLLLALLQTAGVLPALLVDGLPRTGRFLIIMALTSIGLRTDFREIAKTGPRPMVLGFLVWVLVFALSLGLIHLAT